MSEILGHDVNGRPLRAGDRVVPHDGGLDGRHPEAPDFPWTVARAYWLDGYLEMVEPDKDGDRFSAGSEFLRRIDDRADHQPSEYTFDSLMDHLKSGVPA